MWPNEGFIAALIELEKKLNKGKATMTVEEYEHWGDYDGPAEDLGEESHGASSPTRTKADRKQAAIALTQEALKHREEEHAATLAMRKKTRSIFRFFVRASGTSSAVVVPTTTLGPRANTS